MSYEPRGKVKGLIDAMGADPKRVWSSEEVAKVLGVAPFRSTLLAHTDSACRNGALYRRMQPGGELQFRLIPFDGAAADTTSTGWTPPQMVAPRGSPAPVATSAPAPTASPARSYDTVDGLARGAPRIYPDEPREDALAKMTAARQEPREPAGDAGAAGATPPTPTAGADLRTCTNSQTDPKCLTAAPPQAAPAAADASIQQGAGADVDALVESMGEEDEPQQEASAEPVTWNLWEDGDLDLFGLQEIEGGGHRLPREALARLRKFVAWMPA